MRSTIVTDEKKPETVADEDLETVQGGLYTTSSAGTELYSTSAAGTELMTDASTMEAKRRLKKDGDGFIAFGNDTGL